MRITMVMSEEIGAAAAEVWPALSDFATVEVGGEVTSFETKGTGVGMERIIGTARGPVAERLDRCDADAMVYTYSITDDDNPLPIADFSATGTITAIDSRRCKLEWTVTFRPKGPEAAAREFVEFIYRRHLRRMRERFAA